MKKLNLKAWVKVFTYQVKVTEFTEDEEGWTARYRLLPRWYFPVFWLVLIISLFYKIIDTTVVHLIDSFNGEGLCGGTDLEEVRTNEEIENTIINKYYNQ